MGGVGVTACTPTRLSAESTLSWRNKLSPSSHPLVSSPEVEAGTLVGRKGRIQPSDWIFFTVVGFILAREEASSSAALLAPRLLSPLCLQQQLRGGCWLALAVSRRPWQPVAIAMDPSSLGDGGDDGDGGAMEGRRGVSLYGS